MANLGKTLKRKHTLALLGMLACAITAHAGRPLVVDDAGVDEVGAGHVDAWFTRDTHAGSTNSFAVVPSYGISKGMELDAILSRNSTDHINTLGAQLKLLLTPTQKQGCNLGATLGAVRSTANSAGVNTAFLNGLFTCNEGDGALHINAGASKASAAKTLGSWGVALEKEIAASYTGHIELFGQQQSKPTVQLGVKKSFDKIGALSGWQLDGTVGRTDATMIYTLGTKLVF
jgi:hypothetical protein